MAEFLTTMGADGEVVVIDLLAADVEAVSADMDLGRGDLPPVEELARRSARGASDTLSHATARMAAQLRRQTGSRDFRHSITRWRAAAMLTLRCWAAWLGYVFAWAVRRLAEAEAVGMTAPSHEREMPQRRAADLVVRCHPRTGPPALVAALGAPVISP
jgi:hypothetical protein